MLSRITNLVSLVALTALLAACGGGSKSPAPPLDVFDPPFLFATPSSVTGAVGTTVSNPATGGGGTGAITYVSSNASVATVNVTTGVATLLTVGTTTITATKAASSGFNQLTASYALTVTMGSQSIAFAQTGPLQVLKGFTLTNTASGGAGTGAITYASSTTNATVNPTSGVVTGVTAGSATITATKAADANYVQAQATYTVNVQTQTSITAWVGANDSQVTVGAAATGAQLIRSRDRGCNIVNYSTCTSGQVNIVGAGPITDTANTASNGGYYWLENNGASTAPVSASIRRFSERIGHTAFLFKNRYWVIGGALHVSAEAKADVWSSADGKTWELETNAAAFGPRWLHQSIVYNGKMWVFGGQDALGNNLTDVWSSSDGITWNPVTSGPAFIGYTLGVRVEVFGGAMWIVSAGRAYSSTDGITWTLRNASSLIGGGLYRADASLTSFNGALWYVGGTPNYSINTAGTSVNDVWKSTDGMNWTQVTSAAAFAPRWRHAAFVMNNKLWIYGGGSVLNGVGNGYTTDAWSTSDGVNWTTETVLGGFAKSQFLGVAQENNKVTLIGGLYGPISNKTFQSTDGHQWTNLSAFAAFLPRQTAGTEFLGDLWVISGGVTGALTDNQIWRSSDGINWSQVVPVGSIFSPRDGHSVVVFNNRMWVIAGWDDLISAGGTETRLNDVWSTADGINWTKHTPVGAIFSPRVSTQAVVFNNKLWIIGGSTGTTTVVNDVWSTVDGVNWTLENASANFPARNAHGVAVLNGTLWLTAGQNTSIVFNDIWKSTDGINWTAVVPSTGFASARSGHAMAVFNNRIWLSAGWNGLSWNGPGTDYFTAARYNDVWSSADGVSWRQEIASAPFEQRTYTTLIPHNNELWLIGGFNYERFNDVWRSADGASWRVGFNAVITAP